jgi:hypothetical protein
MMRCDSAIAYVVVLTPSEAYTRRKESQRVGRQFAEAIGRLLAQLGQELARFTFVVVDGVGLTEKLDEALGCAHSLAGRDRF